MLVGANLFDIVAAQRQVGNKHNRAIFRTVYSFNQPISGDDGTVSGGDVLAGVQSKLHRSDFPIHAELESLVLLQHLIEANFYLLPVIVEGSAGLGDLYFLPSIGQLHGVCFRVQNHAKRGLHFPHLVLPQIEGFGGNRAVLGGRKGRHHLARSIAQGTVRSDDILGGGHLIDRSC